MHFVLTVNIVTRVKVQVIILTCFSLLSICCLGLLFICCCCRHYAEENYDYYLLCDSGNCHCFHRWGDADLNLHHSHTKRHTNTQPHTQQSKNTTNSHFQFPVFMNAINYMSNARCVSHCTTHFTRGKRCYRMSCYFVNVWCCKMLSECWVLSTIWCFQKWILEWQSY